MSDCTSIDPLITPYIDGDIDAAERQRVDAHVRACPPCYSRVVAEQAVRDLLRTRRASLSVESASAALRDRCAALGHASGWSTRPGATAAGRHVRIAPLALAATLVLVVGGAFLYVSTDRSTRVLAAELTADHVKCFRLINNVLGTRHEPGAIESSMASRFAWQMRLPEHPEEAGLELIGARPCLYAEGLAAHIMYRHNGEPVSVFMLPKKTRSEEQIEVLGHQAAIWSSDNRTFVLIAREPRAEVERMTAFVHSTLR